MVENEKPKTHLVRPCYVLGLEMSSTPYGYAGAGGRILILSKGYNYATGSLPRTASKSEMLLMSGEERRWPLPLHLASFGFA